MRAAEMKERPTFPLMRQTDVQSIYHMQMPRWLFSDPRYADLSLDAKVTYTFLLNRFQLSRRNGWTNDHGEVFVIFPRRELARELRICEQRVTAAFRQLAQRRLIWEKRCGRGDANQIYLASVEPLDDPAYSCAPFTSGEAENCGARTTKPEVLTKPYAAASPQEPQELRSQSHRFCDAGTAESVVQEPQQSPSSKKEDRDTEKSHIEVSPPVYAIDGLTEEEELAGILDACELSLFPPETARVFENAVERLYYSDHLRIGGATLPGSRVRSKLALLNEVILQEAERKLHANLDRPVKNSTAYVMATIFNCITESESDLMVDPYLNGLRAPPEGR